MEVRKIPKKTITVIEPARALIVDKKKYAQKRVAAYCRVSTGDEEQLTSFKNQKKVYTEMIASNPDWEFVDIYADEGISGTRADKRPDFQRMLNDCYKGKIDYIVTKSVSRFARNTVDCLDTVRNLKERGIGVFFEEQNIDTLKSDSELYLVIYAGFAQSESESISKNITWSFRKNFSEGKAIFIYSKLLGYRKGEDGLPEIIPEEAALVHRIFDLYLSGQTTAQISKQLREEQISFPNKNISFSDNGIRAILRNEKYCGDVILQKTITVDCIAKKRKANTGEAPMYLVENHHPAIISREVFNKVQTEFARRAALSPKTTKQTINCNGRYSKYALSEVLKCGECGSRYKRVTWVRNGEKTIVWRCINRVENGVQYCPDSFTVKECDLHAAIVRAVKRFNSEDSAIYRSLMSATIGEAIGINGNSDEIDLLNRRIDALNKKMLSMVSAAVEVGTGIEDNESEYKEISNEIAMLNERIEVIREAMAGDKGLQDRLQYIQDTMDKRMQNSDLYDDSIVRQMIECIKVFKDGRLIIIFGTGYEINEQIGSPA